MWCGSVQICETPPARPGAAKYVPAWKSVEALLGLQLDHPNIVQTFKHSTVLVQVRTYPPPIHPSGVRF